MEIERFLGLPELLSLKEACEVLNCHPNTLRQWDNKRFFTALRIGPRQDRKYLKKEIMKLLAMPDHGSQQMLVLEDKNATGVQKNTTNFQNNMSMPVHRWFRYTAGFSASWASRLIRAQKKGEDYCVLDPFVGSGTVLLEAELADAHGIGIEAHPLISRVAKAKLNWREKGDDLVAFGEKIVNIAEKSVSKKIDYPDLICRCYPDETLQELHSLKEAVNSLNDGSSLWELSWLALVSILRMCSPVGTAQWQYVLPKKTKGKVVKPFLAYRQKIWQMSQDMTCLSEYASKPKAQLIVGDARTCNGVADASVDLVLTSPPYINNYDYADATRLELMFLGEVVGWKDLQKHVREELIPSCTQHVGSIVSKTDEILADELLEPIREEILMKCELLKAERENHGGKKNYHTMVAAYFRDMAKVWHSLRRVVRDDGLAVFVIGDSAPYGIHIPVEEWTGRLAVAAGFKNYTFEKMRDRNIKWKNRKHTVPLKEGNLFIYG